MGLDVFFTNFDVVQSQSLLVKIIVSTLLVFFIFFLLWNIWQSPEKLRPDISLERVAVFHIKVEPDIYQIGIVARLFNKDPYPRLFTGISLDPLTLQSAGGGGGYLQKLFITDKLGVNVGDMALPSQQYRDFKILLPIKWGVKLMGTEPIGLLFISPFLLNFKDGVESVNRVKANRYGNFNRTISVSEWEKLLTPSSTLNMDDIIYKQTPDQASATGQVSDYIVYNRDSSATIEAYGFDRPGYKKNDKGVIAMLKGRGVPVLDGGWILLAKGYEELAQQPSKLALYNSIFPPNEEGITRRLDAGFRAADVISVGPIEKEVIPWMCDFMQQPPYCGMMTLPVK